MFKKALFLLSTIVSITNLYSAAKEDPLVTVVVWKPDSTKVAIGNAQGMLFVFDRATETWTQKEHVEGGTCYHGCHKPLGITTINWLSNGNLLINGHIEFHLGAQEVIRKYTGRFPYCFRCSSDKKSEQFIYKKNFETEKNIYFFSPDQEVRLAMHLDPTEPNAFTFSVHQLVKSIEYSEKES